MQNLSVQLFLPNIYSNINKSFVAENNPKFFNSKLKQTKKFSKTNDTNPYAAVYSIGKNRSVRYKWVCHKCVSKRTKRN